MSIEVISFFSSKKHSKINSNCGALVECGAQIVHRLCSTSSFIITAPYNFLERFKNKIKIIDRVIGDKRA